MTPMTQLKRVIKCGSDPMQQIPVVVIVFTKQPRLIQWQGSTSHPFVHEYRPYTSGELIGKISEALESSSNE